MNKRKDKLYHEITFEPKFVSPGMYGYGSPHGKQYQMLQLQNFEDRDRYLCELYNYVVMKKGR
jgi:hypothetical protein